MQTYRIASASRLTGIPADTIRKWERRYAVVMPRRDARGIRRYSELDLKRLSELRAAVDLGYPIGEAAALEASALAALVADKMPQLKATVPREKRNQSDSFTRAILSGLERYDGEQMDRMLTAASHLLSPAEFVFDVMSPLFKRIGESWRRGTVQIGQEHLFSAVARSVLGSLIRRYAAPSDQPIVLFTTPAGEPHEFGILLAAMLAASEGKRVHYLGPDMPFTEIARTAAEVQARTVVLGAVRSRSKAVLGRTVRAVAAALPVGTQLWLGGKAADHASSVRGGTSVTAVPTLQEFYQRIRTNVA